MQARRALAPRRGAVPAPAARRGAAGSAPARPLTLLHTHRIAHTAAVSPAHRPDGRPLRGRAMRTPARAAGNEAAQPSPPSPPPSSSPSRHAPLHDFCMLIPYGCALCAGGLVTLLLGAGATALAAVAAGSACLALAAGSLAAWRAGRPSTPWTFASAGATAATAWWYWVAAPPGAGASLAAGLSAAMAGFLGFNLVAGGNPPPRARVAGGA